MSTDDGFIWFPLPRSLFLLPSNSLYLVPFIWLSVPFKWFPVPHYMVPCSLHQVLSSFTLFPVPPYLVPFRADVIHDFFVLTSLNPSGNQMARLCALFRIRLTMTATKMATMTTHTPQDTATGNMWLTFAPPASVPPPPPPASGASSSCMAENHIQRSH